jgi:hypothetical protein
LRQLLLKLGLIHEAAPVIGEHRLLRDERRGLAKKIALYIHWWDIIRVLVKILRGLLLFLLSLLFILLLLILGMEQV